MIQVQIVAAWLVTVGDRQRDNKNDRGDVPGWVMVTVMTGILVVAILGVFEPQIKTALTSSLDSVSNGGK